MASNSSIAAAPGPRQIALVSQRRRAWRTFSRNRTAVVGLVMVILLFLVAIFAPWIAPHDPLEQSIVNRLQGPSPGYPLGRDAYGRDVLSRIIFGTRVALEVGVLSVLLGGIVGTTIGVTARLASSTSRLIRQVFSIGW